jgi:hypothetical protein
MLRSEIRRLVEDRGDLRVRGLEREKETLHRDRKLQLLQEMTDKLKSERYELSRNNHNYQKKVELLEKKLYDANLKIRLLSKDGKKSAPTAPKTNDDSHFPIPSSKSHLEPNVPKQSSVSDSGDSSSSKEIPDFDAWRLRLDSLSSEKAFLMSENDAQKHKLQEQTQSIESLQTKLHQIQMATKNEKLGQSENERKLAILESKLSRAKKVAAFMEKQLKVYALNL